MKKKLLFLIIAMIAIIVAIIVFCMKGQAVNIVDQFYEEGKIEGLWTVRQEPNGLKHQERARIIRRRRDNKLAYCVEPFQSLIDDLAVTGITENQAAALNISEETWNRIELLAYYGYGYGNHNDINWYSITQELIWRTVFPDGRFYYVNINDKSEITDKFASEIVEIEHLVSEHYKAPKFGDANKFQAIIGQELVLTDNNNVLANYDIVTNSNLDVTKSGNKLTIIPRSVGNYDLVLEKKDKLLSTPTILYPNPDSQDVMTTGMLDPVILKINLEVIGGKVTIHKQDKDTLKFEPQGDGFLSNAIYGVYKEDGTKVAEIKTDENGDAISEYLPFVGRGYVQEITASEGYRLDTTKYYFDITTENLYPEITVQEDVIDRKVNIFKVYASDKTGFLTEEANVQFDIFLKSTNELIGSIVTDENGKATIVLPYGTYIVRQATTSKDHEKVEDFEIIIKEDMAADKDILLSNAEIVAKLKVVKIDAETQEVIKRSNIKFKIYNITKEEYVCQKITYPHVQEVCIFETDENGEFITPYSLQSGKYRLEEIDQKIDGYLWNQESEIFEIGENSELISSENGIIFEMKFANYQSKGHIKVNKIGENLIIEDGNYKYEKIPLSKVVFEIIANEDIVIEGYKYFTKGDLVGTITTDESGYAELQNLPLGKYLLKEKSTGENHVLDIKDYEFELRYQDQYTEIVVEEFIIENYYKKGTLDFTKVDLTDGTPIPNVEIKIYTENDELIYTGITDENGKIVITDLPVGKPMYLIETRAADNYQITNEKVFFEIRENGEIVKASLSNEKIDVPDTGMNDNHFTEIVGSFLILFGIGVIAYAKKKRK